ncbi:MAG: GerMN domain-containing protein [Acidobacteriota bacterium]
MVLALLLVAAVWLALGRREEIPGPPEEEPLAGQAVIVDEEAPLADPQKSADREVVLFFSREGTAGLYPEMRRILVTASLTDQVRQVVEALIRGPRRALGVAVLPKQAQLRQIYLDREGNAYVDFTPELVTRHPGGTEAEVATLFALVNALTYNFPEIRSVQILVDGEQRETLAGHLDLGRRYYRDLSRVDSDALEGLLLAAGGHARR